MVFPAWMFVYTCKLLIFKIVCGPNQTSRKILEFTSTANPCCSRGYILEKAHKQCTCNMWSCDIIGTVEMKNVIECSVLVWILVRTYWIQWSPHQAHVVRSVHTCELWYLMMYETQCIRHTPHWWILNSGSQSENEFTFRIWNPTQVHCLQIARAFNTLSKIHRTQLCHCIIQTLFKLFNKVMPQTSDIVSCIHVVGKSIH
jgi:hypothetical protein